jgi:HSP90 family molecular chaperone
MATKRSEQEWRELINNFERYGYQNPAVFYIANDVHARDLQQKQMELKANSFIPVIVSDDKTSEVIARMQLPSGAKLDILSLPALVHLVNTVAA